MEKTYHPHAIEKKFQTLWEKNHLFSHARNSNSPKTFCMMLPPPNVTGTLHMGHAFQHTIMDILARTHRMGGEQTLWQPGTDHAGIATQMVVERQLLEKGKSKEALGREKFIDTIWDWKKTSGTQITQQMRRLGVSVDWERERFTLDEGLSAAVKKAFVELYREGLIYRGERLVNWDPSLRTAVSDLEVVNHPEAGTLWHIDYPLAGKDEVLTVATTRPETMLGDSAVAVHPNDERYQHLIGERVVLPLSGCEIPIIADEYVDFEFGTGCVKITPAHDFNDYKIGKKHKLPMRNIFTEDAKINDIHPQYQGLDRFAAREKIVDDLQKSGALRKIIKHKLTVPRSERTGAIIEPRLTRQWFVKTGPLAEKAMDAVKNGEMRFVPKNWEKTYFDWMENIEDWCISRQIWWGHQIPAWYDEAGNIYVAETVEKAQTRAGEKTKLRADEDVLDTWFSSALWPFSTLDWPKPSKIFSRFYPTDVLVTGFDIIFFWVARMMMFGLKFTGDVPFKTVYITGLVRDHRGQKMSKSKGNVLDPLDVIDGISLEDLCVKRTDTMMRPALAEKIKQQTRKAFPDGIPALGADALRFTFAMLSTEGRDIHFDIARVRGYRNFCNKLWNAARFVMMQTDIEKNHTNQNSAENSNENPAENSNENLVENLAENSTAENQNLTVIDRWIISRLERVKISAERYLKNYRLDLFAGALYHFVWDDFCDWYLELAKPLLAKSETRAGTHTTLHRVLDEILLCIHPIIPFITEEIYAHKKRADDDFLMMRKMPEINQKNIDEKAEDEIVWLQKFILGIRKIRAEGDIAPGKKLPCLMIDADFEDERKIEKYREILMTIARLSSLEKCTDDAPKSAMALVGAMKILIPLADLVDKKKEIRRLEKEIEKTAASAAAFARKLQNQKFVENAPQKIVAREREKLSNAQKAHQNLRAQLAEISE